MRVVGLALCAGWSAVVGCSSTERPPAALAALDGGASMEDASRDEAASLPETSPAIDAAEEDAGPPFCVGDDLLADGGDAGLACDVSTGCMAACSDVVHHYRAGVAQVAIDCMRAMPVCASADDAALCVDRAMALACPTTTAASYCDPLLTQCVDATGDAAASAGTFPRAGCEVFANALAADGRAAFAACVTATQPDGGCPQGVVACADAVRR